MLKPTKETYRELVKRHETISRMARGVTTFRRIQISRVLRGGTLEIQSPGLDKHLLCLPLIGGTRLISKRAGSDRIVKSGEITLLPAGEEIDWILESPAHLNTLNLAFHPSLLEEVIGHQKTSLKPCNFFHDPQIERLVTAIGEEADTDYSEDSLFLESLVYALAVRLVQRHSNLRMPLKSGRPEVKRVLEIVHGDLATSHTLESLAPLTCLSPFQLGRIFKAETGQSLYSYILTMRLERARELLVAPHKTIAEIAQICGFYDQSHLARHFRRAFGYSPGQLRP